MLFSLLAANPLHSQNDAFQNDVSLHVGLNLFQLTNNADITANDSLAFGTANGFGTPTVQIAYDHAFKNWFSLGASFAQNSFGVKFTDLKVGVEGNRTDLGDVKLRFARNSFTIRPLFHYGGNSQRLDLYSGFRFGFSLWTAKANIDLTEAQKDAIGALKVLDRAKAVGILPQFAVTLFGLRGYITDNIGVGFELNLGSPYMLSGGVDYRFGGGSK